ncbi:4297_t:CDS:2, partial [Acaulospora colombiana]
KLTRLLLTNPTFSDQLLTDERWRFLILKYGGEPLFVHILEQHTANKNAQYILKLLGKLRISNSLPHAVAVLMGRNIAWKRLLLSLDDSTHDVSYVASTAIKIKWKNERDVIPFKDLVNLSCELPSIKSVMEISNIQVFTTFKELFPDCINWILKDLVEILGKRNIYLEQLFTKSVESCSQSFGRYAGLLTNSVHSFLSIGFQFNREHVEYIHSSVNDDLVLLFFKFIEDFFAKNRNGV